MKVQCITDKEFLEKESSYNVYAIMIWKNRLKYLLLEETKSPFWHFSYEFEIIDNLLPIEWYFDFKGCKEDPLEAIWGYKEIVLDNNHRSDLLDRVPKAIAIFEKRKREIDDYETARIISKRK